MATPRSEQIDLEVTTFYHVCSKVVRGCFLFGKDESSGKSFDHRKDWVLGRLKQLVEACAIQICAYSVLSNHFHVVLRVMTDEAATWDEGEVIRRVRLLWPACVEGIENWAKERREEVIATWRERLTSISWFMGKTSEYIARRANKEEGRGGRFWEGRFRCQALLDEAALLICMSYVDLNEVRAGIASGLDDSDWASVRQRILELLAEREGIEDSGQAAGKEGETAPEKEQTIEASEPSLTVPAEAQSGGDPTGNAPETSQSLPAADHPAGTTDAPDVPQEPAHPSAAQKTPPPSPGRESNPPLAPMQGDKGDKGEQGFTLPVSLEQYTALLEEVGRQNREDDKGRITGAPSKIIEKLGLDPEAWLEAVEGFASFGVHVGNPKAMDKRAAALRKRRLKGRKQMDVLYAKAG